jgi:hypothetical protein
MADCSQIPAHLADAQSQLNEVEAELDDPQTACDDAGLQPGSDQCTLYIKSLHRREAALQTLVASLQSQLSVCGTWLITIQDPPGTTGQFSIETWDSDTTDTWNGTISLSDGSPQGNISGFYYQGDIQFTERFSDGSTEVFTGTVNLNAQPATMQGSVVINPPAGKRGSMPTFAWSAQKAS